MEKSTFICIHCGGLYPWKDATPVNTKSLGGNKARYICPDCKAICEAGTRNNGMRNDTTRKEKACNIRYTLQGKPLNDDGHLAMLARPYYYVSSVSKSGLIDYSAPSISNLRGLRNTFRSVEEYVKLDLPNAFQEIAVDVSWCEWLNSDIAQNLLSVFAKSVSENMGVYGYVDGIQCVENNSISLAECIKFVDITSTGLIFYGVKWSGSDRFFETMQMLIDIVDAIRQALDGELAPHKAERKVERTVVKYVEGRANCQRPERCSKKAI